MPATYQGTVFRHEGAPMLDLARPACTERAMQRDLLDTLARINRRHLEARHDNSELVARIASYELAYKMQTSGPEAVELARESQKTLDMYGRPTEVKELHAMILYQLGFDPNQLTYFYGGLGQKLIGTERVSLIHKVIA
jgi:hypothetical protein